MPVLGDPTTSNIGTLRQQSAAGNATAGFTTGSAAPTIRPGMGTAFGDVYAQLSAERGGAAVLPNDPEYVWRVGKRTGLAPAQVQQIAQAGHDYYAAHGQPMPNAQIDAMATSGAGGAGDREGGPGPAQITQPGTGTPGSVGVVGGGDQERGPGPAQIARPGTGTPGSVGVTTGGGTQPGNPGPAQIAQPGTGTPGSVGVGRGGGTAGEGVTDVVGAGASTDALLAEYAKAVADYKVPSLSWDDPRLTDLYMKYGALTRAQAMNAAKQASDFYRQQGRALKPEELTGVLSYWKGQQNPPAPQSALSRGAQIRMAYQSALRANGGQPLPARDPRTIAIYREFGGFPDDASAAAASQEAADFYGTNNRAMTDEELTGVVAKHNPAPATGGTTGGGTPGAGATGTGIGARLQSDYAELVKQNNGQPLAWQDPRVIAIYQNDAGLSYQQASQASQEASTYWRIYRAPMDGAGFDGVIGRAKGGQPATYDLAKPGAKLMADYADLVAQNGGTPLSWDDARVLALYKQDAGYSTDAAAKQASYNASQAYKTTGKPMDLDAFGTMLTQVKTDTKDPGVTVAPPAGGTTPGAGGTPSSATWARIQNQLKSVYGGNLPWWATDAADAGTGDPQDLTGKMAAKSQNIFGAPYGGLPAPNRIVGRNWNRLGKDTQDFIRSDYESQGWSPNDVDDAIDKTGRPGAAASSNTGGFMA